MQKTRNNVMSVAYVNRLTDEGVNEQIKTEQRKKCEFVYFVHKKQYR